MGLCEYPFHCPTDLPAMLEMCDMCVTVWPPLANMCRLNTWHVANSMEKLNFKFDLILINWKLKSQMCLMAFIWTVQSLYLLKMGRDMRSEGLGTDKILEILILTLLFHQIFPRFRIELRHVAFSKLEREMVYGTKKQTNKKTHTNRVSLWDSVIGN